MAAADYAERALSIKRLEELLKAFEGEKEAERVALAEKEAKMKDGGQNCPPSKQAQRRAGIKTGPGTTYRKCTCEGERKVWRWKFFPEPGKCICR